MKDGIQIDGTIVHEGKTVDHRRGPRCDGTGIDYAAALNSCAAAGISPLCANCDPEAPQTINDMLEKLGSRLPPIPDEIAKALVITTIYSLDTILQSFA